MSTAIAPLSRAPINVPEARGGWLIAASLALVDALALIAAFVVAVSIRHAFRSDYEVSFYLALTPAVLLFLAAYALADLYPAVALSPVLEVELLCKSTTATYLLLLAFSFFLRDVEAYSRAALVLAWVLSMVATVVGRLAARHFLGPRAWWGEPVVLLGNPHDTEAVVRQLRSRPGLGLKPYAILSEADTTPTNILDVPVVGRFSYAPELARQAGLKYCILAMPQMRGDQLTRLFEQYASGFRTVVVIPDLFGLASLGISTRDFGGILGLEVRQQLLRRWPRLLKRAMDLLLSITAMVCLSPLFLALYLIVRLSSPGGAIFGHTRIGQDGHTFRMLKFRTMREDGAAILERFLANNVEAAREWERDRKLKDDPRVTAIGRLLRRTSLDELPQFWNVFRGDMSLIGPRPIPESEVERYPGKLYFRVRPGITGLWQVSGRNATTYAERIFYDEYYVRNWSVWLDTYILSRTIRVVLTGEGAY